MEGRVVMTAMDIALCLARSALCTKCTGRTSVKMHVGKHQNLANKTEVVTIVTIIG